MIHPDLQVLAVEHTYNLRRRRNPRTYYTNRYGFQETIIHCDPLQLSMKRGLRKFKQKGEKLVTAELEKLHRRDSFRLVRTYNLSEKQQQESLALLMFLKEKRYGSIKGCGLADRRKQRDKIEPKDSTSMKVSTEAVMLTATIDAIEGIYVAVVDIPGSYLSAYMDNEAHVVFRGALAEMMVAADPELYLPFVSCDTGQAVLYVRLQKALYGCLKSALIFYEKLVGYLEAYWFRINT